MVLERGAQAVNQDADAVKAHTLALAVEVKVLVMSLVGAEALHCVLKGLLDRLLVALLVDEVDKVELAVELKLVVDVRLDGLGLRRRGMSRGQQMGLSSGRLSKGRTVDGLSMTWRSGT